MCSVSASVLFTLRASFRDRAALQLEILALRYQLQVVNRFGRAQRSSQIVAAGTVESSVGTGHAARDPLGDPTRACGVPGPVNCLVYKTSVEKWDGTSLQ